MRNKVAITLALLVPTLLLAQTQGNNDVFQKANNAVNKATNVIAVFQPLLLKAREVYYDTRQAVRKPDSPGNNSGQYNTGTYNSGSPTSGTYTSGQYPAGQANSGQANSGAYPSGSTNGQYNAGGPTAYLQGQSLPVNNPAAVNNDGTGNWGNQNNGLYGNCLDAMTGTVMGIGEAVQKPGSVDLLFFAPSDGQNTYYIMTPDFARNNSSAGAMSQHATDAVAQWSDVNETEVSPTRLTIGQFQQIRSNSQIMSAVLNASGYSGYYASVGRKLDGQVFAVKAQLDNRQLYALVAVLQQMGTSGSNGYLKIMIKAQGMDNNSGQTNANAYLR
jgi:hypothetical protein